MAKVNIMFKSEDWVVQRVKKENSGLVRIDAEYTDPRTEEVRQVAEWCSIDYAKLLYKQFFGKRLTESDIWVE